MSIIIRQCLIANIQFLEIIILLNSNACVLKPILKITINEQQQATYSSQLHTQIS